ncbi:hypothetical protein EG329_014038 [Mollisiaceae sp. DMI_Dod_QoI]|nr:hypothetical protein EG329_014038 [Helotiales sp. DMI_Dod_QoI]
MASRSDGFNSPFNPEHRRAIRYLREAFPEDSENTIITYLERHNWDAEQAINALLARQGDLQGKQTESSTAQDHRQQAQYSSGASAPASRQVDTATRFSASLPAKLSSNEQESQSSAKLRKHSQEKDEDDSAAEWLKMNFGNIDGVIISLDSGIHPARFPRELLRDNFLFFRSRLQETRSEEEEEGVRVNGVSRVLFDVAIRYVVEGTIVLTQAQKAEPPIEISSLIQLAEVAQMLGQSKMGRAAADKIRIMVRYNRAYLQPKHIDFTYSHLEYGHPIREVIVHTLLRAYITFRHSMDSSGEGKVLYNDLIEKFEELKSELNNEVVITLHGRDPPIRFGGRDRLRFYDPLEVDVQKRLFELA